MKDFKKWLPDVVAVVVFVVLSVAYFFPSDFEGRILYQHDTSAGAGAGQEAKEYFDKTGERTRWTNALFSGMPTYQISPSYDSTVPVSVFEKAFHLWLPDYVWHLFVYLLGFYILLRAFDFKQYLAVLGSIMWAFSSYFLIIIAAGHMWKVMALGYLPPMIAGVVLAYRGRYLWGLVVTAVFAALEIHANHVQMTYYYLFIIAAMVIAFIIEGIRKRDQLSRLHVLKATGVCLIGGLLGVLVNISNLYHTWEYSKATMRGGSELKAPAQGAADGTGGLDRDYITQYSYGIGETWSLLIPNIQGGASMRADAEQGTALYPLGESSAAKAVADESVPFPDGQVVPASYIFSQIPQYWGDGGTMGPVYVGAFVCMLFVLSLLVLRGPLKWTLLAVTVLSVFLAWGRNMQWFTDLFIDYVPMYAKFRTVESILVIAEFTIPLLAILGLREWMNKSQTSTLNPSPSTLNPLYVAFGLTAGVLLLFALLPTLFFNFVGEGDGPLLQQISALQPLLESVRRSVFTADCWRSLAFVVAGAACLWLYMKGYLKARPAVVLVALVCLIDLWTVNKRYLNDSMFRDASIRERTHQKTPLDDFLLQDQTLDYRVLNMPYDASRISNVFNENETSYRHKSVGGYHAAKLQRYQDLIDSCLYREMMAINYMVPQAGYQLDSLPTDQFMPVLNMLNTRWVVVKTDDNHLAPMLNEQAFGNAWMVDKVNYVETANEELAALTELPLRHEAVADKQFADVLGESVPQDSLCRVTLDSYQPNQLTYTVESGKGGVVVFSEIYYPDWTATVDDAEVPLGRVNYVLRALKVAPGKHRVVLSFFPRSVKTTETIAYCSYGVLAAVLLLGIFLAFKKKENKKKA